MNELPKRSEFNYDKTGQIFNQTLDQTLGQTLNKENENCSSTFRVSKNNYDQFKNISHGNASYENQESQTNVLQLENEPRCPMKEMLQNTVEQGMYNTTNAKTYNCSGWNEVDGNKNLDRPSEVLTFRGIYEEKIENSRLETQRFRRLVIEYLSLIHI